MVYAIIEVSKMSRYITFPDWATQVRVRYNRDLFQNDIMYFSKIWKAHRQAYIRYCNDQQAFHDYEILNERLIAYEKRILNQRYDQGLLTDQQFRDALWEIQRR